MSTYKQIFYHIAFATKHRAPSITEMHEAELYRYIFGVINNYKCKLYRINSLPDHIHICSDLHPMLSLSSYVKGIKVASSMWMKETGKFTDFKGWQDGYGAFTCSNKEKDGIISYIKNQKEHHKTETFCDEYRRLLIEHDIVFDEKYLL